MKHRLPYDPPVVTILDPVGLFARAVVTIAEIDAELRAWRFDLDLLEIFTLDSPRHRRTP